MPLIEKVEKKLGGWKGKFLSNGCRLELVRSVLSAIPIYYMTCFRLPQWVIARINKVRRGFLWGKGDVLMGGFSLTNWAAVCIPRNFGGFGVSNLNLANIALLLRWWWKAYQDSEGLWSVTVTKLKRKGANGTVPRFWLVTGSLFWGQLKKIKALFVWSTKWEIGRGDTISYWLDSWERLPRAITRVPIAQRPTISLREAWQDIQPIYLNETLPLDSITFTEADDKIRWRWDATGEYKATSLYKAVGEGGLILWQFRDIWKCKIPPTVKILLVWFCMVKF